MTVYVHMSNDFIGIEKFLSKWLVIFYLEISEEICL